MTIQQIQDEWIEIRPGRKLFVRHWILNSAEAVKKTTTINLVCVHGTAASQEQYLPLWKALDTTATTSSSSSSSSKEGDDDNHNICIHVWAYDAVGCGKSPKLENSSSYTDDEQVQDLTILIENHVQQQKQQNHTTYFMGHSYGPTWIYKYLLRPQQQPKNNIGGLILISSGLRCQELVVCGPKIFHYLPLWLLNCMQPMLTANFLKIGFSPTTHKEQPELIEAAKSDNNQNDMQTCVYYYQAHDWLAHVNPSELLPSSSSSNRSKSSSILVLHGTDDEMVPIHCGQALANALETDLVSVPNASHMVLLEQPQILAQHILAFIKKQQQQQQEH
ncbi:unnamed protein product [Cylindrotheca closterium]|uniref:Serine aminopeptidase S33 domain-containing protein n=1 Tax=Cylindrotheca closterium TaxID=2856 RepID=A0AAD2FX19_9STRA|nr:unnamed protein product [Cylindrotheca closterium]